MLLAMQRDIRDTALYREVEQHFRAILEPGFGTITGADSVAPAPDGGAIAFTGSKLEKLEGTPASRICLADPKTGELREVTGGPNDDILPRWSPDGRRLAFLSDRAEKGRFQLFMLARDRLGEAEAAPEVEGSIEYHEFSPDGRRVLLGVAEPGADRAGGQGSGRVKGADDDLPDWIPAVEDREGRRRLYVFNVEARTVRPATREGLNVWEATWCGPNRLAAIVSDDSGEGAWYLATLVLID